MRKVIKSLLLIFALICTFKVTNVLAATNHQFSLRAYKCASFTDELECTNPTQLSANGMVNPGDVIKLDLYYIPGSPTDVMMQVGVYYNTTDLEPVTDGGDLYIEDLQTTYYGGIYPAKGTSSSGKKNTNWMITPNISNGRVLMIIEDNQAVQPLETEGVLTPVYFRVKSTATPGDELAFTYDNTYTKLANKSGKTTSGITLKVYKQLNTNANLSSITVTSGGVTYPTKETFSANTTTYNVYVPNNVSTVNVDATAAATTTNIAGRGNQTLSVSTTKTVNLVTTAESGATKTYAVKIYRLDNTNTLSALSLSNVTLNSTFASGTTTYTANVPYTTSSTTVSATASKTTATVSGTGSKSLAVGENIINVTVTPENCKSAYSSVPGNTCQTKTYKVTVNRAAASTNAYLSDLTVDGATVTGFNKNTLEYTLTPVANSKSSIIIDATAEDTTATITGKGTKTLSVGDNSFNVVVTAQDGTTKKTYKINVKRKSNDATLKSLSVEGYTITPTFASGTLAYTLTVPSTVSSVNILAQATNAGATVTGTGTKNLSIGSNTATVKVTPEDGTAKEYVITITRKNNDATLKSLSLSGITLSPTFASGTTAYTATVPYTTTSTTVSAAANDSKGAVEGTGTKNLAVGTNTITVTGKAEDRNITKAYTVTVTRQAASTNANLSDLKVDGATVTGFNKNTLEYTLTAVNNDKTSITIAATAEDTTATITGTGSKSLSVGNNTFNIVVTAQDGTTSKTYKVNIRRKSNDALLKSLSVTSNPSGSLVPSFASGTITYTYTVGPDVTEVNIQGTANSTLATVEGNGTYNPLTTSSVTLTVTAEDNTKKYYTINLVRNKSTDNNLKALSVEGYTISPSFAAGTTAYTLTVPSTVTSVNVIAEANDTKATVTGDGNKTLSIGSNLVTVKVVSEANVEKDYKITITRQNNDATLKTLSLSGVTLNPTFASSKTTYTATVPYTTTSTTVSATPNDSNGTVTGTGAKTLAVGENTITVTGKAQDRNITKDYTVVVTRQAASTNAYLSDLKVDGATITGFNKNTLEYTLDAVANSKSSITIAATAEDTTATVTGTGSKSLSVGNNTFNVVVTAQDGTTKKTYKINVKRKSNDSALKALSVTSDPQGSLIPSFASGTITYTYTVGPDVTEVEVLGTANSTLATVTGNGTYNPQTTAKAELKVTAEDETYTTYTINFSRNKSTNANLKALSVEGYTLEQSFSAGTLNYTLSVPYDVTSVNVVAEKADSRATMTGTGTKTLAVGNNTAEVKVTAEDGTTKKTYKITIRRLNNDATLSTLALSNVNIGTFNKDTLSYNATVPYSVESTNITATPTDSKALVTAANKEDLIVGLNIIRVNVKAEDRSVERTYTVNVIREAVSTNAKLGNLKVNGQTIEGFNPNQTSYNLTVGNDVSSIDVEAIPESIYADVEGDGTKTLTVGNNQIVITVTAEDGQAHETYTINVTREGNDNNYLSALAVEGYTLNEAFVKTEQNYTLTVPSTVESLNISATPEVTTSTVAGTGTVQLTGDETTIKITVTSQKGVDRDYTIVVTREDGQEYITSVQYGHTIEDGMIKTVEYKSLPETLKDQLDNENSKLHIWTYDEAEEVSDTVQLATGMIVKLVVNNRLHDQKTVIVKGDVNGDGDIALLDAVLVLNHYLEKTLLDGPYLVAADVNGDGDVGLLDAVLILNIYLAN